WNSSSSERERRSGSSVCADDNARRHALITRDYAPLIENSVVEHKDLIEASQAEGLIRKDGWIKIFRNEDKRDGAFAEAA
ncbi:hypothetical protein ACC754_43115, partial [Rhizobium johnstonii]